MPLLLQMSGESLKEATLTGVRWVMLARVVSEAIALASVVAMARLVTPAEFGRAAVALILVPLGVILTFEGFASAIVQRRSFERAHLRTATLMSLVAGGLLCASTLALTVPVWRPLFGAETAGLIDLVSPVFILAAVGCVPRAILWRQLDFRRISLIDAGSLLLGSVVAVTLAALGMGAEAIIAGALAQVGSESVLLFACSPAPRPGWDRGAQRELSAFGIPAALAGLVHVLFKNVDYAILAARLTAAQTGIYWRAFNLGVVYQDKLSNVMVQLAFPVYSRTADIAELRRLHERATRVHAAVILPLLATLIVLAPILIPFVFGAAWTPAVVPAQILAGAGMMAAVLTGYPQVMLAVGKPKALLRFNVAMLAVYATAIAIASSHGLVTVSITVVGVYAAILVGVYRLLLAPHVGIPLKRLAIELRPAVVGCLVLVVATLPLRGLLEGWGAPAPVVLAACGAVGLVAYGLVLRVVFPLVAADLWMLTERVVPALGRLRRYLAGVRAGVPAQTGAS